MFNFHKPRVYRSADGCCICRAKSSSSRFTASRKYEKESMQCFNLREPRNGEICNACVLLVKRYKRLPVGSKRHWGHVVDARAGPGTKSLAKQKKRENESEAAYHEKFAKILKKNKGKIATAAVAAPSIDEWLSKESSPHSEEQPSDSNESYDDEQHQLQLQRSPTSATSAAAATPYQTRKRTAAAALLTATTTSGAAAAGTAVKKNIGSVGQRRLQGLTGSKRRRMLEPMKNRRAVDNVPFFEEHDLLRLDVCCGTVFQSLSLGSNCYIIDPELYKPCEKHLRRRQQQQQQQQQQVQPSQSQVEVAKPTVTAATTTTTTTTALKKHHLFFKRQSESFPGQGEIHRISPIPLSKTEVMPVQQQQQQQQQPPQHSTVNSSSSSLSLVLKPTTAAVALQANNNIMTTTAVGAASPSSLSSSSNCSTSSSVATKFNDNSSDSGFDEHVLEMRKSVSPPSQDEQLQQQLEKKRGVGRLILASGLPISGQTQNLLLTGNEFAARFVHRQQAQALKILSTGVRGTAEATATTTVAAATVATTVAVAGAGGTGSQSSGNCNKMRAIFNNANTIQHENGVTTILPASSLAASNQTAAMNAIAPSTVTITPAKQNANNNNNNNNSSSSNKNNNSTVNATPKFILLKSTAAAAAAAATTIAKFGNSNQTTPVEVKIA